MDDDVNDSWIFFKRTLAKLSSKSQEALSQAGNIVEQDFLSSSWFLSAELVKTLFKNGRGTLEEGETAEARFIKIQAAYELLIDADRRKLYDMDNRVNRMKASQAWMEYWLMKKRKAFDQRGDMAIAAWAEQQQRDLNVRVRQISRSKVLEYA